MVLTEVETSMVRIRLVGRRIEVEVALKVPVCLNSRRRNQILSMRLPSSIFHRTAFGYGWLSINADPQPKVSSRAGYSHADQSRNGGWLVSGTT